MSTLALAMPAPVPQVLIVEDDAAVASGLVRGLRAAKYEVELVTDGLAAIARACQRPSLDLIVLDLMLPGADGFHVLSRVRASHAVPVIVLSARNELSDRLRAFELGAVDFVAKPFWIEELVARIRTRLNRVAEAPARCVRWESVVVDLDARTVVADGQSVHLTRLEFSILAYLLERPGRAVARAAMADAILELEGSDARTVDSHVARVRRKLGSGAARFGTVWGIGYRFVPGDDEES